MISFFGPPVSFQTNLWRPERLIVTKQYKLCKKNVIENLIGKKKERKQWKE